MEFKALLIATALSCLSRDEFLGRLTRLGESATSDVESAVFSFNNPAGPFVGRIPYLARFRSRDIAIPALRCGS